MKKSKGKYEVQEELNFIRNEVGIPIRGECRDAINIWKALDAKGIDCSPSGENATLEQEESNESDDDSKEDFHLVKKRGSRREPSRNLSLRTGNASLVA